MRRLFSLMLEVRKQLVHDVDCTCQCTVSAPVKDLYKWTSEELPCGRALAHALASGSLQVARARAKRIEHCQLSDLRGVERALTPPVGGRCALTVHYLLCDCAAIQCCRSTVPGIDAISF